MVRGLLVAALPMLIGTCRLADLISTPTPGFLVVSPVAPDSLPAAAALGSTAPRFMPIVITNTGEGALEWEASIQGGSPWLSLNKTTGNAPDTLWVRMNPTGLPINVYRDTVVVSATSATGVAQQTPIKFVIHPCTEIAILVDALLVDTLTSADCGAPHRRDSYAKVYSLNGTQNESLSVYVAAPGFDGYVFLDTSLTGPPLVQSDNCLGATGDPCIFYQRLPATRQYWVEVTSSSAGESGEFTLQVPRPRKPNPPSSLDQRSDSTTVVPRGGTIGQLTVTLTGLVSDLDLGDSVRLQAEVVPNLQQFSGTPSGPGGSLVANGERARVSVSVSDNQAYHWQVRAVDNTGRAGDWVVNGGNPDFTVQQPEPPTDASALGQWEGDSSTSIQTGGTARSDTVVLTATVRDNDPDDQLRLLVEVKPIGMNFTGVVTDSSDLVPNNTVAAVRLGPEVLQNNTNYKWRARVVDQTGRMSPSWVQYGGNPESQTDFRIQVPNRPSIAGLSQFQSDGTTPIPHGGDANIPTVVLKATVTDLDVGQTIRLEVEVKPLLSSFTNTATAQSTPVSSGQVASATVTSPDIAAGGAYKWQARAVDNLNFASGWVPFLPDTGPDFRVATTVTGLVFTTQPVVDTAGRPIRPNVVVEARDVNNNLVTGFNGPVTMFISSNPAGGTLTGNPIVNASNGIATFSNLIINKAGTGYRITATIGTVNSAPSNPFNVIPAPATQLFFMTNPPASTVAGVNMSPAIVVTAQDQFANTATSFTGQVSLSITPGTGTPGATLNGGGPVTAIAGQATFSTANITRTGTGYRLTATSAGLTPDTSTTFNITHAPATQLAYAVQPSNAPQSIPIAPTIQVAARDQFGNDATTHAGSVTLSITPGTGTGGAVLSGGGATAFSTGIAAFPNASINLQGTGYRLNATSTGLASATSSLFDITQGQVSAVNSTVQASPATITACSTGCTVPGGTLSTITVTARDGANAVVSGASVTVSVTGSGNTVLPPGSVLTNASGVATFTLNSTVATMAPSTELKIISAIISSVPINQRDTVTVNPGPATALVFTMQPGNTTAGVAINSGTGGVEVTARDQFGNTATSFASLLTMAIVAGPPGGVFAPTSTNTATPVNGVATFPNLRIYQAGTSYQIRASGGALQTPFSNAFTITTAPASRLAFVVQPSTTADSAPITPAVQVAGQDSVGNNVTNFTGLVRMFIDNPGTNPGGGALSGTTQVNAQNGTGIATFSNLRINARGTGYTLLTTSSGLTDAISNPFDIIAGPAVALFFTVQPSQTVAGSPITPAVQVTARDNQGNTADSYFGNVTLTIGTNPSSGTLSGGGPLPATAGVVSFPSASINNAGPGYTLNANATGLTGTTSVAFNIISGGASATTSTVTASTPITACSTGCTTGGGTASLVTVTVRDALSNPIQGATVTISATGANNSYTQPVGVTGSNGQITGTLSSTLSESKTVSASIVVGANPPVTPNQMPVVQVNPAAASVLLYTIHPNNTVATQTIRPATGIQVEVRDQFNNRVTTAGNVVDLAILNNAGNPPGTLSGDASNNAVGGLATFTGLSIDKIGTGYTLLASSTGLTPVTSVGFNITVGAANRLGFVQQPTNTAGGATITPAITVEVQDAGGNRVTSSSANVTLAIATNPAGGSLSGDSVNNAASGLASFPMLSINNAGTGYTLQATSGALTPATSAGFDITVGSVSASMSTVVASQTPITACDNTPPCTTGGGTASLITVTARDAAGNAVAGASVSLAATGAQNFFNPAGPLTTNGSGVATATFRSTVAEAKTISATINTVPITQTAPVTVNAAAVSAATSSVGASPTTITASTGSSTSTITVTVRDEFSNPLQGAGVVLSATGSNNTFTQPGNTNSLGVTTGTFRSTTAEGKTISATVNGSTLITQTAAVTVNPAAVSAAQSLVSAAPGTITASTGSSSSTVTVTVRDQFMNPIPGAAVVLSATGSDNGFGQPGNTNSSGVTTGTFNSTRAEAKTVSATAQVGGGPIVAITQTAGVTVNPASADHLAFGVEPTNTQVNQAITPAVTVEIRDAFDNLVSDATNNVTLVIGNDPSLGTATLTGGGPIGAVNGVATFGSLSIDIVGNGYTLNASAGGLTGAGSASFDITL